MRCGMINYNKEGELVTSSLFFNYTAFIYFSYYAMFKHVKLIYRNIVRHYAYHYDCFLYTCIFSLFHSLHLVK